MDKPLYQLSMVPDWPLMADCSFWLDDWSELELPEVSEPVTAVHQVRQNCNRVIV
ncbi:hypothetical protein [Bifidobacterium longum]|uniref:hypothetical protein n=1 Tax=Bifidobacterium longum TaxID=216816 RepID=UPI00163D9E42|nr:hypothetical protein [Bifidobacterium longum]